MVRIGNGQGFWGDSPDAAYEQLTRGPLDYLGLDYLAEVTLSIMMRQRLRDPHKGYATDFVGFLRRALPIIAAKGDQGGDQRRRSQPDRLPRRDLRARAGARDHRAVRSA